MMNNKSQLLDLLRLIYAQADLNVLLSQGLRYSQISQLLEIAVAQEYIRPEQGKFSVTQKGLDLIHQKLSGSNTYQGGWIKPSDDRKIKKIDLMSICLPTKETARRLVNATSARGLHHRGDESSS